MSILAVALRIGQELRLAGNSMACGNNNVDRSYLNSQPNSTANRAMASRIANQAKSRVERTGPFPKATTDAKGRAQYYSRHNELREGETEYFVDTRGLPTFETPHVHVIHDEKKGEVRMHISEDRSPRQSEHVVLPGTASGNEVNAAVDRLVAIMRDRAG